MTWEIVIGLETHAQLNTQSKIFSGAATAFGAEPNAQACAIDLALPGVLPVLNRTAVQCAIRFGLAVDGNIAPRSVFARKNYFYPDLPKGYQISQFELPVVSGGTLSIRVGEAEKTVRLTRAHLEEDAGKSLHEDFHGKSGIDLNRAGTPLLEIVSEPDMRSSAEAVAYAKALHALVMWIGICDGNMQEGSFRCDANVSVRRPGAPLGTRREIKNLNSFRFLQQAIDYEVQWQINEIEEGRKIQQATVLFDPDTGETRAMRSKEDAQDYRYFPDPDLLPLEIAEDWVHTIRSTMPESREKRRQSWTEKYEISAYIGGILVDTREMAEYFDAGVKYIGRALENNSRLSVLANRELSNWLAGEFQAMLTRENLNVANAPISPEVLAQLMIRIVDNTVSGKIAKEVLQILWPNGGTSDPSTVDSIINDRGLKQITDTNTIEAIIDEVLAANQKSVEEFRAGKEKAFNALVGQAMKATKGKANPQQVNDLLRKKLGA